MHVWCLLDPKQNSSFIWAELISSPWDFGEERTVSWHRCCWARIFPEVCLSVCLWDRAGQQGYVAKVTKPDIFCRSTQTFPLQKLEKREPGMQSIDRAEINSDTAMAVRVDPTLGSQGPPGGKGRAPLHEHSLQLQDMLRVPTCFKRGQVQEERLGGGGSMLLLDMHKINISKYKQPLKSHIRCVKRLPGTELVWSCYKIKLSNFKYTYWLNTKNKEALNSSSSYLFSAG